MRKIIVICWSLMGCAVLPYEVHTRAIRDNADKAQLLWFDDGPELVIVVRNNTDTRKRLYVSCAGSPAPWVVDVNPYSEVRALGQVMNRDVHNACTVSDLHPTKD